QTCSKNIFPIDHCTLHGWHRALFPTGWSGLRKIDVGAYRNCPADVTDASETRVFYSAPKAESLADHMNVFLDWFNNPPQDLHPLIYSAIAHLWFVAIHPYEDGNGRIARALADLALTRQEPVRLYATAPIMAKKESGYYQALHQTNHTLDITPWLITYIYCVDEAVKNAYQTIDHTLKVASFWQQYAVKGMNERQIKVVKKLLDAGPQGFQGGMRNKKYCAITGCSNKTAAKDLKELMQLGVLYSHGAGRSTAYDLDWKALPGSKIITM
ncbi:MAG: Fic family protein, partial [Cellvibrionaceae bacterium]|nr:Fic family protein [Cellvibrionaceae bacterium]